MNDKLRELREETQKSMDTNYEKLVRKDKNKEDLTNTIDIKNFFQGQLNMLDKVEKLINTPKHETVEEEYGMSIDDMEGMMEELENMFDEGSPYAEKISTIKLFVTNSVDTHKNGIVEEEKRYLNHPKNRI